MTGEAWASARVEGYGELVLLRVEVLERLDEPWRVAVLAHRNRAVDVEALFGGRAELELTSDTQRRFVGVVDGVEERDGRLEIVVAPKVALLASTQDHRVFLDKDVVDIVREVLAEHGISLEERLARTTQKRSQCVQAFESDLDFVTRLLADEGISWFADPVEDRIVLADHTASFHPVVGSTARIPLTDDSALAAAECFFEARLEHRLTVDVVRLRDYDPERPALNQNVEEAVGWRSIVHDEVPGGYRNPDAGKAVARRRLEEARTHREVFTGRSTSARLAAGSTFELEGSERGALNRSWLIEEAKLVGLDRTLLKGGDRALVTEILATLATEPRRPKRRPTPRMGGVQTATITGPAGSEVHTSELGHATALLRWDRRGKANEKSSRWVRSLQPQTTGAMFLPRVGWDALVGFSGASADEPYVLGRLDHGAALPAEKLPVQKVRSAFGSLTTPGGGSKNALRMDDAAGNEGMLVAASKDHSELTAADKVVSVSANDSHTIGAERKTGIGAAFQLGVAGSQAIAITGSREVGIGGSRHLQLASHATSIGAARTLTIGGDLVTTTGSLSRIVGGAKIEVAIDSHHRHVSGTSLVLAAADMNETGGVASMVGVLGNHVRASGGPVSIRAPLYSLQASTLSEHFGSHSISSSGAIEIRPSATASVSVKGAASFSGSSGVVVSADSEISIEAGGAKITITPSSVTLKGPFKEGENVKILGKLAVK